MKISRRPISMPTLKIHFALFGRSWKVPVGPIILPKPGPTFEMDVTAPAIAVRKSSPTNERAIASTANDNA